MMPIRMMILSRASENLLSLPKSRLALARHVIHLTQSRKGAEDAKNQCEEVKSLFFLREDHSLGSLSFRIFALIAPLQLCVKGTTAGISQPRHFASSVLSHRYTLSRTSSGKSCSQS